VTDAIKKFQLMQKKTHKKEKRRISTERNMKPDPQQETSKGEDPTEIKTRRK
jgi:hypothetical protein